MSLIVRPALGAARPGVLCRPFACSASHLGLSASRRGFSYSAPARLQPGSSSKASTALRADVKDREVKSDPKIVGDEGKLAEGPHYQGEYI